VTLFTRKDAARRASPVTAQVRKRRKRVLFRAAIQSAAIDDLDAARSDELDEAPLLEFGQGPADRLNGDGEIVGDVIPGDRNGDVGAPS